jgi:hypothetical protein
MKKVTQSFTRPLVVSYGVGVDSTAVLELGQFLAQRFPTLYQIAPAAKKVEVA